MALYLLDVNVLHAIVWPQHSHHRAAHAWLDVNVQHGRATCAITQAGFVRLSCNPKVQRPPVDPPAAIRLLAFQTAKPTHEFWECALPMLHPLVGALGLRGYNQVTDAYLLALAMSRNSRLATFDAGVPSLAKTPAQLAAIELIQL